MIYKFVCYDCELEHEANSRPLHPPPAPCCPECGVAMDRVFGCQIDTSGCKDHDYIPQEKRVLELHDRRPADVRGAEFQKDIELKRKLVREAGPGKSFRMSHSVPADLFHGKIRETGDKHYWDDPTNLKRHKSAKVT